MANHETKVEKLLVVILDPHFKNMKIIWEFVGNAQVSAIVVQYDVKNGMPYFVASLIALKPC
jgi:hypothetical protein